MLSASCREDNAESAILQNTAKGKNAENAIVQNARCYYEKSGMEEQSRSDLFNLNKKKGELTINPSFTPWPWYFSRPPVYYTKKTKKIQEHL